MEVIEHKENQFPTDKEGRLNAILNVVNTELKTITLLHLGDSPIDHHDIKRKMRETVGDGIYLPNDSRNFESYCSQTFYPIGAVAKETILRDTGDTTYFGYCLTDAGRRYGLPIAAFTLDYAVRGSRSMFTILGSTSSPLGRKRAPLSRINILKELRKGDLRVTDLERKIGISDTSIVNGLVQLKRQKLVSFESVEEVERGTGQVCYEWMNGKRIEDVKPCYTDLILTRELALLLKERGRLTSSEAFSEFQGKRKDIRTFTNVLGYLVREGVANTVKWTGTRYSDARITNAGKSVLADYIDLVESALTDGPELNRMQRIYFTLMGDQQKLREYARIAIKLYKNSSGRINPVGKEKRNEQIVNFIRTHPGMRPVEIKDALGFSDIAHFLTPLVKSGVLRKEKTNRDSRYFTRD